MFIIITECFEKLTNNQIQQENILDEQSWDYQTRDLYVLGQMTKQQKYIDLMKNCQYTDKIKKSLSHNIRNIVYSFLSLQQFYFIMNNLQKSEKAVNQHEMNNRLQRGEQFLIYPENFGYTLDLEFIENYTFIYTIIFRQTMNQSSIKKVLNFFKIQNKYTLGMDKPQINIEMNQCQITHDIFINQWLVYQKIQFNKLSIINSEFTFSNSNLYPLINLFPKVHLKDSLIGHQYQEDVKNYLDCIDYLQKPNLKLYSNLKELRMDNCVFIDSKMLASTKNLVFLIIQDSHLSIPSQNILRDCNNTKLLKQVELTFNKEKLNILKQEFIQDQTELCQNIQKLERIQYDIFNAKFQQFLINANGENYKDTISRLQNYIELNTVFNKLKSINKPIKLQVKITSVQGNFKHKLQYADSQTQSIIAGWLKQRQYFILKSKKLKLNK